MQRFYVASVLVVGLFCGAAVAQQCPCPQPSNSIAQVVACPCPQATCMTVEGTGEIGTWLKFEPTNTDTPNLFTLGLPASSPVLLDPSLAICNDLKTNPHFYLGELCIAQPMLTGVFWLFIPFDVSLVGVEVYSQFLWQRPGDAIGVPPVMSSMVLSVTVRDRS